MSFKVDPEALREFSTFLEDLGADADKVEDYFTKQAELGVQQTGLLDSLMQGHASVVEGMEGRMSLMSDIALGSSTEVSGAAYFYSDMDTSKAASIDETYKGSGGKPEGSSGDSSKASFEYEPFTWADSKRPEDLEPKATEVEDWCRTFLDTFSIARHVREIINYACGTDPFEWLYQWWCGDWKAFAKCSLVWESCGTAVKDMADNFDPALNKLPQVWEGKAANHAAEYFAKLQEAVATESETFFALEEIYRLYMEAVHEWYVITSDLLNTAIDTAIDLLLLFPAGLAGVVDGLLGGDTGVYAALVVIWDLIGQIGIIVTTAINAVKLFETLWSERPDIPPCELVQLPERKGKGPDDHAYDHLDPAVG